MILNVIVKIDYKIQHQRQQHQHHRPPHHRLHPTTTTTSSSPFCQSQLTSFTGQALFWQKVGRRRTSPVPPAKDFAHLRKALLAPSAVLAGIGGHFGEPIQELLAKCRFRLVALSYLLCTCWNMVLLLVLQPSSCSASVFPSVAKIIAHQKSRYTHQKGQIAHQELWCAPNKLRTN